MKKIILSLAIIGLVAGVIGGATFALFSDQATVSGNTFSTGNADLQIRGRDGFDTGNWKQDIDFNLSWDNIYPGWTDSYKVQLRNASSSPIWLRVVPKLVINEDDSDLRHVLTMRFIDEDENVWEDTKTLADWRHNEDVIEFLNQTEIGEIWTVEFEFPSLGQDQNHLQNSNPIEFDLVFDAVQDMPYQASFLGNEGKIQSNTSGTGWNEGEDFVLTEEGYHNEFKFVIEKSGGEAAFTGITPFELTGIDGSIAFVFDTDNNGIPNFQYEYTNSKWNYQPYTGFGFDTQYKTSGNMPEPFNSYYRGESVVGNTEEFSFNLPVGMFSDTFKVAVHSTHNNSPVDNTHVRMYIPESMGGINWGDSTDYLEINW